MEKALYKSCFVVLPMDEENNGYEKGHFSRLYEKLIKPSIMKAGFIPLVIYEVNLRKNPQVEIIRELVSSPVVLFDISIKSGWMLTVLGTRYSYKTPMIVIQDDKSFDMLNTGKFEYIEYSRKLSKKSLELASEQIIKKLNSFEL